MVNALLQVPQYNSWQEEVIQVIMPPYLQLVAHVHGAADELTQELKIALRGIYGSWSINHY